MAIINFSVDEIERFKKINHFNDRLILASFE